MPTHQLHECVAWPQAAAAALLICKKAPLGPVVAVAVAALLHRDQQVLLAQPVVLVVLDAARTRATHKGSRSATV